MEENDTKKNDSNNNNNIIEDRLTLTLNTIKKDLRNFVSKSDKNGYRINIKLNEKNKKIKLFITLLNNSDTNDRNEDIDFLIEINENFPDNPPIVFGISCVKLYY